MTTTLDPIVNLALRPLADAELDFVGGGMKWQRGTANPDVIDARGGSIEFLGFVVTFDGAGDVSSVRPK